MEVKFGMRLSVTNAKNQTGSHQKNTRNIMLTFIAPIEVAMEARLGLKIRSEQTPSNRACTAVGVRRAVQLAYQQPLSLDTLKRMKSYFARHEVDKKGKNWGVNSKGYQAWLMWGGDSGRDWCISVLEILNGLQ